MFIFFVCCRILICLYTLHTCTHSTTQTIYNNTLVSNHSGLYFENQGSLRIINTKWTLLTYVNLTTYNEREKILDNYLEITKNYCRENELLPTSENIVCENFKTVYSEFSKEILNKRSTILKTLGHTINRTKRGLIDGIGKITNILFGICDSDCIEKNIQSISSLRQAQTTSLNILKQQTRVLKTEFIGNEQHYRDSKFLKEKINELIDSTKSSLNLNAFKNQTTELTHKSHIHDTYLLFNLLLTQYSFETNYISEMINLAKLGQVHPGILSLEMLSNNMKEIKLVIPKGTSLPIELGDIEPNTLYKLSEINVVYHNQLLMFTIKIPLVDQQSFNLYNIFPIPIRINYTQFAYIQTVWGR